MTTKPPKTSGQPDSTLRPKQELALVELLSGRSVGAAAKAVGVARQTLSKWLKNDPLFIAALEAERAELRRQTSARLLKAAEKAIDALEAVAGDATAPAPRVTAARSLLELGIRAFEVEELAERVLRLETQQGDEQ